MDIWRLSAFADVPGFAKRVCACTSIVEASRSSRGIASRGSRRTHSGSGALAISVQTGRRYAADDLREFGGIGGLCDLAFLNGNNGPSGYGQNPSAEKTINSLLVGGACVAAARALCSRRPRARRLAVTNLVLGDIGGTIALPTTYGQADVLLYAALAECR